MKYPAQVIRNEPTIKLLDFEPDIFLEDCPYVSRGGDIIINEEGYESDIRQGFVDKMKKVMINNIYYCYQVMGDPGAGTVHYSYYYVAIKNNQCFMISFATSAKNCSIFLPYKEEVMACELENKTNEEMIDQMLSTFRFLE